MELKKNLKGFCILISVPMLNRCQLSLDATFLSERLFFENKLTKIKPIKIEFLPKSWSAMDLYLFYNVLINCI